jgi:hypothetical protein
MDPENPRPARRLLLRGGGTLAALLVLYALSSGPVDYYRSYQWGRTGGGFGYSESDGRISFSGGTLHIAPPTPTWRDRLASRMRFPKRWRTSKRRSPSITPITIS